jgi:hypothetical protein
MQYTGTGTCVAVSAAVPATHNAVGFAALVYTELGELETVGEVNITHQAINFTNLCSGRTSTSKGAEDGITFDIGVAGDRTDAGQALMTTARKSKTAQVSIRITEPSGDVVYLKAYVMGERIAGGAGPNDIRLNVYSIGVVAPDDAEDDTAVIVLYTPPPPPPPPSS